MPWKENQGKNYSFLCTDDFDIICTLVVWMYLMAIPNHFYRTKTTWNTASRTNSEHTGGVPSQDINPSLMDMPSTRRPITTSSGNGNAIERKLEEFENNLTK